MANRKEILEDLKNLSIKARVIIDTKSYRRRNMGKTEQLPSMVWVIVFESQEDMNLYQLAGKFAENRVMCLEKTNA